MARVSTLFFTKVGAEKYEKFTNKTLNPLSSSNYESSDAKFAPVLGRAMMNTLYNMYVQFLVHNVLFSLHKKNYFMCLQWKVRTQYSRKIATHLTVNHCNYKHVFVKDVTRCYRGNYSAKYILPTYEENLTRVSSDKKELDHFSYSQPR